MPIKHQDPYGYKAYHLGTHRTLTPANTLARVHSFMRDIGITRIANITGLDRIGIPVVMVCRPTSRSLAVSQGKGLELAAAKVSGLMEAVETYHAERITLPLKLGSYVELRATHPLADVTALPKSLAGQYHDNLPILWIAGQDLLAQAPVWVPYELVHTNYTQPPSPGSGCFAANTNGLAAGNHVLEAISHGICEVIERDATTLWKLSAEAVRKDTGLDLSTVSERCCRDVLEKFERADIEVKVWETTSDVGVAAFLCLVMSRHGEFTDPEFGAGCHAVRHIALLRALTEAAQARTTYIAGSRDDFTADDYSAVARAKRLAGCRTIMACHNPVRDFRAVPTWETENLADDVDWLLQRLQTIGIAQVIVVDLTQEALQLPVVRVVIPGLEGSYEGAHSDYLPGPRACAVIEHRA